MAHYVSFVRSSYAKVKNPEAFKRFCEHWGLERIEREAPNGERLYGFVVPSGHTEEEVEGVGLNFLKELSDQLAEGWAIEVREIGHKAMRHLVGVSRIMLWTGDVFIMNLDIAQGMAKEHFGIDFEITQPED